MGTDIYLSWDGQTQKEQDAQNDCGFDITMGDVGYLRAAVWMAQENNTLRRLFPQEYWDASMPMEYNFDEHIEVLKKLAEEYAMGVTDDTRDLFAEETKQAITEAIKQVGGTEVKFAEEKLAINDKTKWLKSLVAFFKKGWKLQKAGKKPKVYISW